MNSKQQGTIGIAQAINYFSRNIVPVSIPLNDSQRYDLIVDMNGLKRVEVKTCSYLRNGSYQVMVGSSGGNMTNMGKTKKISKEDCDLLFVHNIKTQENYLIPIEIVNNKKIIILNDKLNKYKLD